MEGHVSSGTQAAALLRQPAHRPQRDQRPHDKSVAPAAAQSQRSPQQESQDRADARGSRDTAATPEQGRQISGHAAAGTMPASQIGRPSALTAQHKLPVLQTDEFRVVEPDGSEDPLASVDDGLAPDHPAESHPGGAAISGERQSQAGGPESDRTRRRNDKR